MEAALRALRSRRSVILAYHGVGTSHWSDDPYFLRVSPQTLRTHVELLLGAGFEFVTVAEFADRAGGNAPPPGLVAISFDDGMQDNHDLLLPILTEYGVPATVYIVTGLIGKPNPWMAPSAGMRMMTLDELRALLEAGIELGAHTVTHPDLSQLDYDSCLHEMVTSRETLESLFDIEVRTFAYPFCRYAEAAARAASSAGFAAAVTCAGRGSWNPYEMKRALLTGKDGMTSFFLKVADVYQPLFDSPGGRLVRTASRGARRRFRQRPGAPPRPPEPETFPLEPVGDAEERDEPEGETNAAERAGARAAKNTVVQATGELVGKLASFVLFAALARTLGETALGVYVFAFAFLQVATMPADFGFDRYLVRRIAESREAIHALFYNVLGIRLTLSLPVIGGSLLLVQLLGYDERSRHAVYVLLAGFLLDILARTIHSVFIAFEQTQFIAVSVVVQRIVAATTGISLLAAGYGVVAVAATYTVGSALGLVLAAVLLQRRIGLPRLSLAPGTWPSVTAQGFPFAMQDVFTVVLFKVDAVILSLMATSAAVGRYGAAYRLLEATFFLTYSLGGAFLAMYTYLGPDSDPPIRSVFQRSVKLALAFLTPFAVVFAFLGEPVIRLFFGAALEGAAEPLRLLAPVVVLFSVVNLASVLITARLDPRPIVAVTALVTGLNIALNVILIPRYAETGAAAAMLTTEVLFLLVVLPLAVRAVAGLDWVSMLAAPLAGGAAMTAVMLPLLDQPGQAFALGTFVYAIAFLAVERIISPGDLRFVRNMVRRQLRSRLAG